MNLRVTVGGKVKRYKTRSRSESESEEGVESPEVDAKPSDLPLSRMKVGEKCSNEMRVGVKG